MPTDYFFGYSIAKSTLQVPLTFNKAEKTKREKVNFVHLLSSFFLSFFLLLLSRVTRKLYGVCKYYTYQTTSLRPNIFLFWFGAAYKLRLESYGQETVPEYARRACSSTSRASVYVIPGVARIVRPHPDYWTRVLQCATSLAGNCQQAEVGLQFSLFTWCWRPS